MKCLPWFLIISCEYVGNMLYLYSHGGLVAKSCPTLCDPHGLKWVAISFSRGSSQPRNQTWVSYIAGRFFTNWVSLCIFPKLLEFHFLNQFHVCLRCILWKDYYTTANIDVWPLPLLNPLRREWLPTPVFLPGEYHGQRNGGLYSRWGRKKLDKTEWLTLALFIFVFYILFI